MIEDDVKALRHIRVGNVDKNDLVIITQIDQGLGHFFLVANVHNGYVFVIRDHILQAGGFTRQTLNNEDTVEYVNVYIGIVRVVVGDCIAGRHDFKGKAVQPGNRKDGFQLYRLRAFDEVNLNGLAEHRRVVKHRQGRKPCIRALEVQRDGEFFAVANGLLGQLHGEDLHLVFLLVREANGIHLDALCGNGLYGVDSIAIRLDTVGEDHDTAACGVGKLCSCELERRGKVGSRTIGVKGGEILAVNLVGIIAQLSCINLIVREGNDADLNLGVGALQHLVNEIFFALLNFLCGI